MNVSLLPPELLLEIFPHLPLKGLIAAQGVNQQWRRLIPLSNLRPARRALLSLYITTISSPEFQETRPLILPHLWPFDREAYVSELQANIAAYNVSALGEHGHQYSRILPDDFRLWLLEWPSRAVIGRIWPGMGYSTFSDTIRPRGYNGLVNWFARSPKIGIIDFEEVAEAQGVIETRRRKMLAIEVWWHSRAWSSWLVIDGVGPALAGTVHGVVVMWTSVHHRTEARSWVEWLEIQLKDQEHKGW